MLSPRTSTNTPKYTNAKKQMFQLNSSCQLNYKFLDSLENK